MHKLSILDVKEDEFSGPEQEDYILLTGTTIEDGHIRVKTTTSSIDKLPQIVSPKWQNTNDFIKSKTSKNQNAPKINIEGLDSDGSRMFPEGETLW